LALLRANAQRNGRVCFSSGSETDAKFTKAAVLDDLPFEPNLRFVMLNGVSKRELLMQLSRQPFHKMHKVLRRRS
jgi:hypothetical protein